MVHSPSKKTSRKSKRHCEDDRDPSQQKKLRANASLLPTIDSSSGSTQPRRSGRAGAGSGGHTHQLERIGAAIERPQRVPRPMTTLSNDTASNPLAPSRPSSKAQKKVASTLYFGNQLVDS